MKKAISTLIAISFLNFGLYTCKPRRSDSGLSSVEESERQKALKTAFAVSMRRKLRQEPGIHFADDSASKILNVLNENAKNSPHSVVRYQSASAVADIAAVSPPWTYVEKASDETRTDFQPKVPTSDFVREAIASFQLKTPVSRPCRTNDGTSGPAREYKFQICSNYMECAQAVTLLTSFTRRNWYDQAIDTEVEKRNELLSRDIEHMECTDGKITRQILEQKHESMKIWQKFNRGSGIEEPGNVGLQVTMDPKELSALKQRLDSLIKNTKQSLLHNTVDRAVPVKLVKEFILDEIMSSEVGGKAKPQGLQQQEADTATSMDEFEAAWNKLDQPQQDTILAYFELTFGSALQTHDANLRLRLYLDRVNQKSVRPWISCINKRVNSYMQQFDKTDPSKIIERVLPSDDPDDRSCLSQAVKPDIAFRTMTMFMRQEMVLPERRFFYTDGVELLGRKLRNNTSGIWKPTDEESGFDPVSEALTVAATYMNTTNAQNALDYTMLSQELPEYFPKYDIPIKSAINTDNEAEIEQQLKLYNPSNSRHPVLGSDPNGVSYEQKIASSLGGYNSLSYQLTKFKDKNNTLLRAHTIQRCIIGDLGLQDFQKEQCAKVGKYNLEEKTAQRKKKDGTWVDFENEEKKEAFQKMQNLEQEMKVQAAVQGCAMKQYGSPNAFPDKMHLTAREKELHDTVQDYLGGFNPYGCWGNVVYNLNSRQVVHALSVPWSMLRPSGSGVNLSEFGKAPPPGSIKLPWDYASDGVEAVFKGLGLEELTRSTNTDSFFKEIPFKPALEGYFETKDICLSKGLKGQSAPSMFHYENSVNRWLSAQKMWDKCQTTSIEIVNLILSAVTMPAIGKATHMIIGKLLFKAPSVLATVGKTHTGILRAASEGRWALTKFLAANPAVLRAVAWQITKNLPYSAWNLGWNVAVFTLLNKALYRGLFLQKFYDPRRGVWDNIGHEMVMGVWFMGGMPAVHKFSRILFPGPISKFMGTGPAASLANFTASVATEATFFRYIGPVAEWVTDKVMHQYHELVYGEPPPEKPDDHWQTEKGEAYEWSHAIMMTLVFRVGSIKRNNMHENHQQLYDAHMARMKRRHYKARNQLGLKTFDPYKGETGLAQNPYSDLFMDLGKINSKNQAEVLKEAEAQYQRLLKGEIKGAHDQHFGEGVQQGDPYAMQVMTNAAHALETIRSPAARKAVDSMLERALKGTNLKFENLSDGSGSVYTTALEHYRLLGLEYNGPGALNSGMLNGKYQQARRPLLEQIQKEDNNMKRYGKNDPKRVPYQERIADLKERLNRVDAAFKLLSNSQRKAEIDEIIEDPRMQDRMQSRIDDLQDDDPAYQLD
ncbi:hypothetical protein N9D31_02895 [Oligoflexaceae bacterium]|nr:hypothetical protein [Oligoflexaceae bacterium]